jgi:glycosyltransferase involved in cell wall biosynthesis
VTRPIDVIQFQRRAVPGAFSIERVFEAVRSALPEDIDIKVRTNKFYSQGVLSRVLDAMRARLQCGSVNHVVGDVHYLTWFMPRHKTILTVHDCVSLERLTGARRWIFWFFWYWLPLHRARHVTVISEYTREALLEWVHYPGRIQVIPPPLSAEFTACPLPPRTALLRLLQVGTKANKNLLRVIEASSGLAVLLVIIGELTDEMKETLQRFAVPFENYIELDRAELLSQYQKAHAMVFASTYEGFGLPIIEAQAVGRPVITSNLCSMPEAAGGAACLVDPFDVNDIRRGIQRLIEDPTYCDELVHKGYENAAQYAPARIAAQYAELYRNVHGAERL